MSTSALSDNDVERAQRIWSDYARQHDLSGRQGQTAGVDPVSGKIWFGESIFAISQQREAASAHGPLYFVRVGQDYYYRKGGRRG